MPRLNRREFISASVATGALASCRHAQAIPPLDRSDARFRGLSLATYSLKRHMKWWKGVPTGGKLDMLGFLEYCAQEGFDAAELTGYFFPSPITAQVINRLKRRAYLLGLDISGGAIGNDFGHPPTSSIGQQQLAYTKSWIDRYADLGAPAIRIFAGRSRPEGKSDAEVLANVVANLEQVLPHAEKRGVMLGLENHDFAVNVDYLLGILSRIDSQWLGVTWDSANLAPTAAPYEDLARIAPWAITAQVKVKTRLDDQPVQADYGRLIEILRAACYRGYIVLEYEEPEEPYNRIPEFAASVRALIHQENRR